MERQIRPRFLYSASLRVSDNENIFDEISDTFGLRYFKIDRENGFYLNGKSYNLRGVSRHQDREGLGNAITKDEHNEDFAFIYNMGVNSIRLAHYPQAEYFYRLCDCYGIVVWAEIPVVDLIGGSGAYEKFDGVLAMYHDQGLAPFKTLAMNAGVNVTAGLDCVRTSPDHGTGFDIAGKGEANEESMRNAIYTAIDIIRNRRRDDRAHRHPLRKQYYDKGNDT